MKRKDIIKHYKLFFGCDNMGRLGKNDYHMIDWAENLLKMHYDERSKDMYPLEFIEWLIDDQEIFRGELTEQYIINDNPYPKLKTIQELFNYWQNKKK